MMHIIPNKSCIDHMWTYLFLPTGRAFRERFATNARMSHRERVELLASAFLPGAFHAFWKGDMAKLQDTILAIQQFNSDMDDTYVEDLLTNDDQTIIARLVQLLRAKSPKPDKNIAIIHEIITSIEREDGPRTVSDIATAVGKSERWLQQMFQEYVGIGLQWLLRRNKLLSAAKEIRESSQPRWAAIAYNAGYSSQQHFITDFKKVLNKTPLQYKKALFQDYNEN